LWIVIPLPPQPASNTPNMSYRECLSLQTRMQCLVPDPNANYRSVIDVRHEGYMYTVRGINVVMYGAGPAHALYFAMYEKVKHTLSKPHRSNHLVHGESGVISKWHLYVKKTCGWEGCLPGNWKNILRIDSNKRELCSFLSKIRRSVRKTSKLSLPLGRGCSAHSYCRMSTPCRHAALKKLIVVCYCM